MDKLNNQSNIEQEDIKVSMANEHSEEYVSEKIDEYRESIKELNKQINDIHQELFNMKGLIAELKSKQGEHKPDKFTEFLTGIGMAILKYSLIGGLMYYILKGGELKL